VKVEHFSPEPQGGLSTGANSAAGVAGELNSPRSVVLRQSHPDVEHVHELSSDREPSILLPRDAES
jgi:hypothetical protein